MNNLSETKTINITDTSKTANVVDKTLDALDEEFKIIDLNTKMNMDIFLRTWLSCSNAEDEQRFLGIMDHCCLKYLQYDTKAYENVNAIDHMIVRKNRKRVLSQLYANDLIEFNELLYQLDNLFKEIFNIVKAINSQEDLQTWHNTFFGYVNAAVNYEKVKGYPNYCYLSDYMTKIGDVHDEFKEKYAAMEKQLNEMANICEKIYGLTEHRYDFSSGIFSYIKSDIADDKSNIRISVGFSADLNHSTRDLEFPDFLIGNRELFIEHDTYVVVTVINL